MITATFSDDGPHVIRSVAGIISLVDRLGVPDVIYERYAFNSQLGLAAARILRCLHCLEVNAPLPETIHYDPANFTEESLATEATLLQSTDLAICVSWPLAEYVTERRTGPTIVVPNGCHPSLYPEPANSASSIIAFLGHPRPWHGADILPRLIHDVLMRGLETKLRIIGGGPGTDSIRHDSHRLGISDHVEITGELSLSGAASRLRDCSIGLAPYPRMDLFYFSPVKIVEYMAAGLAVVAADQGDVSRILCGTGILVPPGSFDALLDAVSALLRDSRQRGELALRARNLALRNYSWNNSASKILEAITKLLSTKKVNG